MLSQYTGAKAHSTSESARSQTGAQSLRMIHWLYPITAAAKTACTST